MLKLKRKGRVKALCAHAARAFTLIELLVVIAIIGLLVTLSVLALSNARVVSRDSKRFADIKQMQSALELFYDANDRYPTNAQIQSGSISYVSSSTGTTTYMSAIPTAPTPADGDCSDSQNSYAYNAPADGSTYTLDFCVAKKINDLTAGRLVAIPGGMVGGCYDETDTQFCSRQSKNCGSFSGTDNCGQARTVADCGAARGTSCTLPNVCVSGTCGCTQDSECSGNNICQNNACVSSISYAGDTYGIVKIGNQYWLDKNLNVGTMIGSKLVDNTTFQNQPDANSGNIKKYCYNYTQQDNNDQITAGTNNCATYGGLYQWHTAMALPQICDTTDCSAEINNPQQGICPTGWHVPADTEQNTLDQYLTDFSLGKTCSSTRSNLWDCANTGSKLLSNGTNSSGFTGLLAGTSGTSGSFGGSGTWARFWSSSLTGVNSWSRYLDNTNHVGFVNRFNAVRANGFSVRCLKN